MCIWDKNVQNMASGWQDKLWIPCLFTYQLPNNLNDWGYMWAHFQGRQIMLRICWWRDRQLCFKWDLLNSGFQTVYCRKRSKQCVWLVRTSSHSFVVKTVGKGNESWDWFPGLGKCRWAIWVCLICWPQLCLENSPDLSYGPVAVWGHTYPPAKQAGAIRNPPERASHWTLRQVAIFAHLKYTHLANWGWGGPGAREGLPWCSCGLEKEQTRKFWGGVGWGLSWWGAV